MQNLGGQTECIMGNSKIENTLISCARAEVARGRFVPEEKKIGPQCVHVSSAG